MRQIRKDTSHRSVMRILEQDTPVDLNRGDKEGLIK
jgi:hypothetical protein